MVNWGKKEKGIKIGGMAPVQQRWELGELSSLKTLLWSETETETETETESQT